MISHIKKNIKLLFKNDIKSHGAYIIQQQEKNTIKIKTFNRYNNTYIPGYKTFDDYIANLQNK